MASTGKSGGNGKKAQGNGRSRTTRSGSETRKRAPIIGFRATDEERAKIEAAARRAGLTVGSYVRSRALKNPETRAVRRPSVETAQLAKLLGMLGIVGGTIARLAKQHGCESGAVSDELLAAVKDFRHAAEDIILTMGKHPHLSQGTHHHDH